MQIMQLLAIFVSIIGFKNGDKPSIEIIFPQGDMAVIKTGVSSITGRYDSVRVSNVQLLERFETRQFIELTTTDQKENFPREVRALFPDNFVLESIVMSVQRLNVGESGNEYHFDLQDNVDLKKFWASSSFRKMLASAYRPDVLWSNITLQGWVTKSIDVSDRDYRGKSSDMFSFSVYLSPAENVFYLRALGKSGEILMMDSVTFFYQTEIQDSDPPENFLRKTFHSREMEQQCSSCHNLTLSESEKEGIESIEDVCSPCHQGLVNQRSSHYPAESWECLTCHDPYTTPKYQLYADITYDASLCFECHSEKEEEIDTMAVVHAPTGSGECLTCHDPHGSRNDALVIAKVNNVCGSCHEDVASTPHPVVNHPLGGRPDPLHIGKELNCATCHNPHTSDIERLLIAPKFQLCQKCHQK